MKTKATHKLCGRCGEIKPFSEFYKNRTKPDKLSSRCKICSKLYAKEYHVAHKEEINLRQAKYYEENKERSKQYQREYRKKKGK